MLVWPGSVRAAAPVAVAEAVDEAAVRPIVLWMAERKRQALKIKIEFATLRLLGVNLSPLEWVWEEKASACRLASPFSAAFPRRLLPGFDTNSLAPRNAQSGRLVPHTPSKVSHQDRR